jgi:hypothetical protein
MHAQRMKGYLIGALSVAVLAIGLFALGLSGGGPSDLRQVEVDRAQAQEELPASGDEQTDEPGEATGDGDRVDFDMRIRSAAVHSVNLDDGAEEFVRVEFTGRVQELEEDGGGFALVGYDSDKTARASSVRLDEDDQDAVLVGFEDATDVRSYALLTVDRAIVEDRDGDGNVQDSVSLDGSAPDEGRTTAPELLRTNVDGSLNRIELRFDEDLDEENADGSRFGFVTANGERHEGGEVTGIDDDLVKVEFGDDADVDDAERIYVAAGAVTDEQGAENLPGVDGGDTAAPELESVSKVKGSDTQLDFHFDEAIVASDDALQGSADDDGAEDIGTENNGIEENGTEDDGAEEQTENVETGSLAVYTEDGERYEADSVRTINGDTLRVSFPDIDDFADQITLAVAERGAVSANDRGAAENTLGVADIGDAQIGAGETSGPDLRRAKVTSEDAGNVRLVFDEAIDDDAEISADAIAIITQSGDRRTATGIVEPPDEGERSLIVGFDETAVQAAEAVTIDGEALQDFQENPNPQATVAIDGSER